MLFRRTIVAIYLTVHFYPRQFSLHECTWIVVAPFFHFPSIFITARFFPVSGTLTFPAVLATAVTFTPLTGPALFLSSFRVLFRRLAYYVQASEFKVAYTKRLSQLFTLVVNYSVCDQRLRTSPFLPLLSSPFPLMLARDLSVVPRRYKVFKCQQ